VRHSRFGVAKVRQPFHGTPRAEDLDVLAVQLEPGLDPVDGKLLAVLEKRPEAGHQCHRKRGKGRQPRRHIRGRQQPGKRQAQTAHVILP
jgi:hypothetical protein